MVNHPAIDAMQNGGRRFPTSYHNAGNPEERALEAVLRLAAGPRASVPKDHCVRQTTSVYCRWHGVLVPPVSSPRLQARAGRIVFKSRTAACNFAERYEFLDGDGRKHVLGHGVGRGTWQYFWRECSLSAR
jgi:hypothetical protein